MIHHPPRWGHGRRQNPSSPGRRKKFLTSPIRRNQRNQNRRTRSIGGPVRVWVIMIHQFLTSPRRRYQRNQNRRSNPARRFGPVQVWVIYCPKRNHRKTLARPMSPSMGSRRSSPRAGKDRRSRQAHIPRRRSQRRRSPTMGRLTSHL